MPRLDRVLETALYVEDLDVSEEFYQRVLEVRSLGGDARMRALDVSGRQILLLFRKGGTRETVPTPGGGIPPHDGDGRLHLAFAVPAAELPAWERRLEEEKVPLESRVEWPRGGTSIYFRDPDGHLVELATPGVWETY